MNAASAWRYAYAEHLAAIYAANPHVAAIIVGGSTGRGHADKYSDIELGVFWHVPPTDDERHTAIETSKADLIHMYPYDPVEEVWEDAVMLGRVAPDVPQSGILIEIFHYTVDCMERTLGHVIKQHDPDENKQNLIAGIVDSIALHNLALIKQWQDRVGIYPHELMLAVIKRHAQIDHFWRWRMYIERDENLMLLHHAFNHIHTKLLYCLLAVNHVYYFGFKWSNLLDERLPIKPPHLMERIRKAYQMPPDQGVQEVAALVEEVYDIIEQHIPDIDVARLRDIFRWQRPVWQDPPPYNAI